MRPHERWIVEVGLTTRAVRLRIASGEDAAIRDPDELEARHAVSVLNEARERVARRATRRSTRG